MCWLNFSLFKFEKSYELKLVQEPSDRAVKMRTSVYIPNMSGKLKDDEIFKMK